MKEALGNRGEASRVVLVGIAVSKHAAGPYHYLPVQFHEEGFTVDWMDQWDLSRFGLVGKAQ